MQTIENPGNKWLVRLTAAQETRPGRGLNNAAGRNWKKKKVDTGSQVDPV